MISDWRHGHGMRWKRDKWMRVALIAAWIRWCFSCMCKIGRQTTSQCRVQRVWRRMEDGHVPYNFRDNYSWKWNVFLIWPIILVSYTPTLCNMLIDIALACNFRVIIYYSAFMWVYRLRCECLRSLDRKEAQTPNTGRYKYVHICSWGFQWMNEWISVCSMSPNAISIHMYVSRKGRCKEKEQIRIKTEK